MIDEDALAIRPLSHIDLCLPLGQALRTPFVRHAYLLEI
jgi:hypothetical protein